ncbi:hypothetical protein ACTXT7_015376 [Hymenolepis weldensis]
MIFDEIIPDTINFETVSGEYIAKCLRLNIPPGQLPQSGRLSNDQYFMIATLDQSRYRLFLSRIDYIAVLFENNIRHDPYVRLHLQNFKGVPIESLKGCPRLAEVNSTPEEIKNAINSKLPHLKIFTDESNVNFVSRKDEIYGIGDTSEDLLARKLYLNPNF